MVVRDLNLKAFLLFKCHGGTIRVVCSGAWEGDILKGSPIFRARVSVRNAIR